MNKVSIVILNYNGQRFLEEFLPSVIANSAGHQIIVADNASTDNSLTFLREHYPDIRVIALPKNGGFAGGYNAALNQVVSEYYVLLNSDIEVTPNWIEPMLDMLEQNPKIAGVQPKVLSYHNRDTFEHAGASGGFLDRNYFPFCRGRLVSTFEKDKGQYDSPLEIFWATGAALMIRSSVYHEVGGLDERFFAHMEEIDLCWRAKHLGYSFMVQPASLVYHVGGGTLTYMSPFKTYLNFRNSLYMITKNHDGILFPKLFWRLCLDGLAGVRFFMKGEFKNVWMIIKSHFVLYANMSALLKDREQLKEKRTNHQLTGLFRGNIMWSYYFKGIRNFKDLNQRLFEKY